MNASEMLRQLLESEGQFLDRIAMYIESGNVRGEGVRLNRCSFLSSFAWTNR